MTKKKVEPTKETVRLVRGTGEKPEKNLMLKKSREGRICKVDCWSMEGNVGKLRMKLI